MTVAADRFGYMSLPRCPANLWTRPVVMKENRS